MATISLNKLSLLATLPLLFCACEESDPIQYGGTKPLSTPVITLVDSQFDQLSFSWGAVEGAIEYSYRLVDGGGNILAGDLTTGTTATFDELTYCTDYYFMLLAYADVQSENTTSEEAVLNVKTPFYSPVNAEGTYTSAILVTKTWQPTLVETRADGNNDWYGTFTLQAWYGTSDYDLQFEVDKKGIVKILNGTLDEATGWQLVQAGPATNATNQFVRKGVLVDESRCSFDREAHELKLYSRSTKDATREGFDTFEW